MIEKEETSDSGWGFACDDRTRRIGVGGRVMVVVSLQLEIGATGSWWPAVVKLLLLL